MYAQIDIVFSEMMVWTQEQNWQCAVYIKEWEIMSALEDSIWMTGGSHQI